MHLIYFVAAASAVALLQVLYLVLVALLSPLKTVPGPFLARFTKAWYFYSVYKGHHERDLTALHRKYAKDGQHFAPVIRIAPTMYSISTPEKLVYSVQSKMPKSPW